MNRKHTISSGDLDAWMYRQWHMFASDTSVPKRFEVSLNRDFKVTVNKKVLYRGRDVGTAIRTYNNEEFTK